MQRELLRKFLIKENQSLREAMIAINENWQEIVFVEDESCRVIGTITDGDIRRGLLAGHTLDSQLSTVINRDFIKVGPEVDRVTALDMMKARSIQQIPIIDADSHLIGIHFLHDLIGASDKPNIAVIMAGGKGTRLKPLTENCPKPMIKVAGRPILERLIIHLVGYGIRKIYIAVNYLSDMIEDYFGDGSFLGCSIEYIREEKALGTGGALSLMPAVPEHPIIVMNGDLVTQVNVEDLLNFHKQERVAATIAARPYQITIPYGVIIEENKRLSKLVEKPLNTYMISTGIYVLDPTVLSLVPENEELPITALFDLLQHNDHPIGVYMLEDEWIDVGRHDELNKANGLT
jgi:dTDP-glucose pyrophosphorylase